MKKTFLKKIEYQISLSLPLSTDNFNNFNGIKTKVSNLKTLLAVGGWNEGSSKFSTVTASDSLRKIFVNSVVQYLTKYGFDGLDIDWEYPAQRGGVAADKVCTLAKNIAPVLFS